MPRALKIALVGLPLSAMGVTWNGIGLAIQLANNAPALVPASGLAMSLIGLALGDFVVYVFRSQWLPKFKRAALDGDDAARDGGG